LAEEGLRAGDVKGIGFDATCSLVALDADDQPVSVATNGEEQRNVVVWMDHRALEQAERINRGAYAVLKYVGGKVSPEMEAPKLLWLKEHLPQSWARTKRFFDLPDFLVYKATGVDVRSLCSTVCKWNYLGHESPKREGSIGSWDAGFYRSIGLGDLVDEGFSRIGTQVRPMGESVGKGLGAKGAAELGLKEGTPVGVSIIDAHAGGLGLLGARLGFESVMPQTLEKRLALIGGTSSCHMAVSREPKYVPGVWGPYFSAMVPGMWLTEGGQSATGALIDHIIGSSGHVTALRQEAAVKGLSIYQLLNQRLERLSQGKEAPAILTKGLHVLPYFHGNRSPRANPLLRGMISGLRLADSLDELALLYLATVQAIAYGTRHIISEMNANGFSIDTILACGGGTKNPLFLREHADATGCTLVLPKEPEAVLLGSSVLGAVAAKRYGSVVEAMQNMNHSGSEIRPGAERVRRYHKQKYEVFLRMYEDQLAYGALMKE
jgi:FGGY-family pentulose kinase